MNKLINIPKPKTVRCSLCGYDDSPFGEYCGACDEGWIDRKKLEKLEKRIEEECQAQLNMTWQQVTDPNPGLCGGTDRHIWKYENGTLRLWTRRGGVPQGLDGTNTNWKVVLEALIYPTKNVDDAIKQFCSDYGYDPMEIETHQFRVWHRNGQYWVTEPTNVEPDAEKVQVRIEPGTDEWEVV